VASRFYVPPEQIKDKRFTLLGSEARHAAVVLRKKPGDPSTCLTVKISPIKAVSIRSLRSEWKALILNERKAASPVIQLVLCKGSSRGPNGIGW